MSTPIETNTEQLQEVLQQVYNLPNRSGGGTTPDLVVVFDTSSKEYLFDADASCVSIESGDLVNTIEKIKNGQHANVLVKMTTVYDMTTFWQVFYPESVGVGFWDSSGTIGDETYLCIQFDTRYYAHQLSYSYTCLIDIDITGNISFQMRQKTWSAE